MNSWTLNELLAWTPPLIIFIKGTGNVLPLPKFLYKGIFFELAETLLTANETDNIEDLDLWAADLDYNNLINIQDIILLLEKILES